MTGPDDGAGLLVSPGCGTRGADGRRGIEYTGFGAVTTDPVAAGAVADSASTDWLGTDCLGTD